MDSPSSTGDSLFEDFRLDRRGGVLSRRDGNGDFVPLAIGSRALDILGVLVERPGDLVSRAEIIDAVWPRTVVEDANLNVQIGALRRILDDGRAESSCIQTISGRGYRFVPAVTRSDARPPQVSVSRPPRLSIVVLPFTNLSDDGEQRYFADGITEDLTTDLSRLADMLVISRSTAITYQGKPVGTKQIGRELGVRYVLEGSVRRSGARFRVSAQLIDTETDAHVWAERFDNDTSDLFAVQDEITSRIAIALNLELVTAEVGRTPEHRDALDYILRGRAVRIKPNTRDNYAEAISLFERALVLDPRSVEAQSRLASALAGRVLDNMTGSRTADLQHADEMVERALARSPNNPQAHFAKGQLLRAQNRLDEAIAEYETALAFDRNFVIAYTHIGRCKLLTGSADEAIRLHEQAIRLSPRDPNIYLWCHRIGEAHLVQSRIDEAIFWLERTRRANPAFAAGHAWLAAAYGLKGDTERATFELSEARSLSGDDRYSSIARLQASGYFAVPTIRNLFETTIFAGLREAGLPEE
jgi:TolB-like protein/tetratricopeptide (TPR) repeat protein